MRHVNQTRDGIIQALTPQQTFRVAYYFEIDGQELRSLSRVYASNAKEALAKAYEIGRKEFGPEVDCNLVFGDTP